MMGLYTSTQELSHVNAPNTSYERLLKEERKTSVLTDPTCWSWKHSKLSKKGHSYSPLNPSITFQMKAEYTCTI